MGTEMWRPKRRMDSKWKVDHPQHEKWGADLARSSTVTNRMALAFESWEADARASLLAHDSGTARIVLAEMKYLDVVGTRETFRLMMQLAGERGDPALCAAFRSYVFPPRLQPQLGPTSASTPAS
jgi:hypothetical protein